MNYGSFSPQFEWLSYNHLPGRKDEVLVSRFSELLEDFPPLQGGIKPYVEAGGLYPGVRIRRITRYDDPTVQRLVSCADRIYQEVLKEKQITTRFEGRNEWFE